MTLEALTRREREVLAHVLMGRSTAEMAGILGISEKTVDTHRGHVLRKLGLQRSNPGNLFLVAVASGWLVPDGAGWVKVTFTYERSTDATGVYEEVRP